MKSNKLLFVLSIIALIFSLSLFVQAQPSTSLQARVAALEAILDNVTVDENTGDIFISKVNLYIQSGSKATDAPVNGKGNLIIGYDEDSGGDDKTGSHNLVIGPFHSYSSYGGLVAGRANTISGPSTTVAGGTGNEASSDYSAILGGEANITENTSPPKGHPTGRAATISGGDNNQATGDGSTIAGGSNNVVSANGAAVNGGKGNVASADIATVNGGRNNWANGQDSAVNGGWNNTASGEGASVSGGHGCTEARDQGWSVGTTAASPAGCATSN